MSFGTDFQPVVIQGGASVRSQQSPAYGSLRLVWRNPLSDPDVELTPDQELTCLRLLCSALSQKKREPSAPDAGGATARASDCKGRPGSPAPKPAFLAAGSPGSPAPRPTQCRPNVLISQRKAPVITSSERADTRSSKARPRYGHPHDRVAPRCSNQAPPRAPRGRAPRRRGEEAGAVLSRRRHQSPDAREGDLPRASAGRRDLSNALLLTLERLSPLERAALLVGER